MARVQERGLFKFRIKSSWGKGRITLFGVILSWKDGMIEMMDSDLKRRNIPEERIIRLEKVYFKERPKAKRRDPMGVQLELFE